MNDRILAMSTLILDYRKLIEKTMVPFCEATIEEGNKAQANAKFNFGFSKNHQTALEATALFHGGPE
jgi:hypothetical protein